jgi:serine/threonine protein kinase
MPDADIQSAAVGLPVLASGLVLAGRFRLESLAGQGGMSVVWRATDMVLEHETALKFLPTVLASDPAALADLRREARRARDLAHPHVCRVYDYGEDPARKLAWISMEFLTGGSLLRKLKEHPRGFLEPSEIIDWMRELCDALQYAHELAQIVHRDLKPANLMLDSRSHLRITDFGIARSISESYTRLTGEFLRGATSRTGTIYYMSPQQARGERPRPTDDLYSLGVTIFELLTGEPPFTGGDLNWQREHAPPSHISDRRRQFQNAAPPVPEAWEILVQRLLAKHQSHRPQNAREVARELSQLESQPERKSPAPVTSHPPLPAAAHTPENAVPPPTKPPVPASEKALPVAAIPPRRARWDPWMWALAGLLILIIVLAIVLLVVTRG